MNDAPDIIAEWTTTVHPDPTKPGLYKIIAVDARRRRVIHADRLTAVEVETFDPAAHWAIDRPRPARIADVISDLLVPGVHSRGPVTR